MELKDAITIPSNYKLYTGSALEEMPKLLQDGYTPISVEQAMIDWAEDKISIDKKFTHIFQYTFCTGDLILSHPDEYMKLVHGRQDLWDLVNINSNIRDGAIVIPQTLIDSEQEPELKREYCSGNDCTDYSIKEQNEQYPTHVREHITDQDYSILPLFVKDKSKQDKIVEEIMLRCDFLGLGNHSNTTIDGKYFKRPTLTLAEITLINMGLDTAKDLDDDYCFLIGVK